MKNQVEKFLDEQLERRLHPPKETSEPDLSGSYSIETPASRTFDELRERTLHPQNTVVHIPDTEPSRVRKELERRR